MQGPIGQHTIVSPHPFAIWKRLLRNGQIGRLVLLGGSISSGATLAAANQTFASLIVSRLNAELSASGLLRSRVELSNLAQGSTRTMWALALHESLIRRSPPPDVVIWEYAANDAYWCSLPNLYPRHRNGTGPWAPSLADSQRGSRRLNACVLEALVSELSRMRPRPALVLLFFWSCNLHMGALPSVRGFGGTFFEEARPFLRRYAEHSPLIAIDLAASFRHISAERDRASAGRVGADRASAGRVSADRVSAGRGIAGRGGAGSGQVPPGALLAGGRGRAPADEATAARARADAWQQLHGDHGALEFADRVKADVCHPTAEGHSIAAGIVLSPLLAQLRDAAAPRAAAAPPAQSEPPPDDAAEPILQRCAADAFREVLRRRLGKAAASVLAWVPRADTSDADARVIAGGDAKPTLRPSDPDRWGDVPRPVLPPFRCDAGRADCKYGLKLPCCARGNLSLALGRADGTPPPPVTGATWMLTGNGGEPRVWARQADGRRWLDLRPSAAPKSTRLVAPVCYRSLDVFFTSVAKVPSLAAGDVWWLPAASTRIDRLDMCVEGPVGSCGTLGPSPHRAPVGRQRHGADGQSAALEATSRRKMLLGSRRPPRPPAEGVWLLHWAAVFFDQNTTL